MIVNVSGVVVGKTDESYTKKGETVPTRRVVVFIQQDPTGNSEPAEVQVSNDHLPSVGEAVYGKQAQVMCEAQAFNGERFARLVLRTKGQFAPQQK